MPRTLLAYLTAAALAPFLLAGAGAGAPPPTFHKDIAPILQERCQSCHRPGQVAPFPLLTFADARRWGAEIREFTAKRIMPPWKAEPGHGDFLGSRRMEEREIAAIGAWVAAGMPEGNPAEAPPARQWSDAWLLGKPDRVLTVDRPFSVSASGDDIFRCFVLPLGNTEPLSLSAIDFRPGNNSVVHHYIAVVDTSGAARKLDERDPEPGYTSGPGGFGFMPRAYLGGWAPGNFPRRLASGLGRPIPPGSDLVLQVHYHKTGKPEQDRSTVALYFGKEPHRRTVQTMFYGSLNIDIPPGEKRHEVRHSMTLPVDLTILNVLPHMHLLGKEMKVTAHLPDGTTVPVVWIRDWDYRWQDTYHFREPLRLPKGTRIDQVAYYDNSADNPLNPHNPPKRVRWGEQTTDEMCFAVFDIVVGMDP